ncbi:MAG: hypothetical protein AB7P69_26850 [Candidatus Binatia bacterium]
MFGRKGEDDWLKQGFNGDHVKEFEKLGVATVRHMYETSRFPNEMHHRAAAVWLGRKEAEATLRASILSYSAVGISVLSLLVSLFVAFFRR